MKFYDTPCIPTTLNTRVTFCNLPLLMDINKTTKKYLHEKFLDFKIIRQVISIIYYLFVMCPLMYVITNGLSIKQQKKIFSHKIFQHNYCFVMCLIATFTSRKNK